MIYDGFILFNELDILELRLEVMYESVDRFILVESRKTFTNMDKPLYFEDNKERFVKYADKIEHIVIDEFPAYCKSAWDCEYYQRNAIYQGIKKNKSEDILIVSDLDEIVSPYGVKRIKTMLKKQPDKILKLELLLSWYYLNYVDVKNKFWAGPVAYTLGEAEKKHDGCLGDFPLDNNGKLLPQLARSWRQCVMIPCAGWHFSYMGGMEMIKKKIQSFSHQEFNDERWLNEDWIIEMIRSGKDLFGRDSEEFYSIPLKYLMPKPVQDNPEKYRKFLCQCRPLGKIPYCKLLMKYLCETTWLRCLFHLLKK